jgi:hypothetical protein
MNDLSRRSFVAAATTAASTTRILGANERIRLGTWGAGAEPFDARSHKREGYRMGRVRRLGPAAEKAASQLGVKVHADYRALVDRKDIDAVIVATGQHPRSDRRGCAARARMCTSKSR